MIAIPTNKKITNVGVKEVLDLVQYYNATGREELAEEEKRKEKRKIINTIDAKPIIYLYPKEKMQLQVNLGYPNNVTCSYPEYSTEGWNVIVDTDGSMIDVNTGRNLYSLYWEGKNTVDYDTSYGFVVKGEDTIKFLEEKLEILGLTEREAEEFIIYWLPQMQNNKYNYIRFATEEEINENMPLSFSIEPDTLIRIIMVWEPLNGYIEIPEQELQTIERKGFVAVEWGGTKLCNVLTQ